MINLINELKKAYNGDAWHGSNTMSLLSAANPAKVFIHPIPNGHSIAEIVLHLICWTEEVTDRINGISAKEPTNGDWPAPKEMSEQEWKMILDNFKKVNETLIDQLHSLATNEWVNRTKDERNRELGTGVSNAELVNGLVQHHAYHSGQIALLLKF